MALVKRTSPSALVNPEAHVLAATPEQEEGYRRVYDLLFERLVRFAERFLDHDDAREAVQRALVHIWEVRGITSTELPSVGFFFRAVRNEIKMARRSEYRERSRLARYASAYFKKERKITAADANLEREELAAVIEATVAKMPDRCREAWVLIRENEFTYAQAADAMDVGLDTAKKHMTRAQAVLREAITDAGYHDAAKRRRLSPGSRREDHQP